MSTNSMNGNGLPVILVDQDDRTRRPREVMFSKWIKTVGPELVKTRAWFRENHGFDMTEIESYQFIAWSMEASLARLMWTVDDDPQAVSIVVSAAFDTRERYLGYRLGAYPPPRGQRFESPKEFEIGLAASSGYETEKAAEHGFGTYL